MLFLLLLRYVLSINIVTWISCINNECITSYFNSDDPTLERYCDKDFSIIKDSSGFYYKLMINDIGRYDAIPIDVNDNYYRQFKSKFNYNQDCFINRNVFLTTNNYGIVNECT